jgi:hypothetical protein
MNLLTNLWAFTFRKVEIAERAMKIHAGAQHVRIDDKDLLTLWTSYLYGLTHPLPRDFRFYFRFSIAKQIQPYALFLGVLGVLGAITFSFRVFTPSKSSDPVGYAARLLRERTLRA